MIEQCLDFQLANKANVQTIMLDIQEELRKQEKNTESNGCARRNGQKGGAVTGLKWFEKKVAHAVDARYLTPGF